jgi:hypothetical protein
VGRYWTYSTRVQSGFVYFHEKIRKTAKISCWVK